jgi:hypothetical protein
MRGVIPVANVPAIIGTGLNQFATKRNDETSYNWELGKFGGNDVNWASSNLLPVHVSGSIGNAAAPNNIMTVVSVNDPTGVNITSITFTEPTSSTDANAIKSGDLFKCSSDLERRKDSAR